MFSGYYSSMIVLTANDLHDDCALSYKTCFSTYIDIENKKRITGFEVARTMLDANGLQQVSINVLNGDALTNYYDPRSNTVNLVRNIFSRFCRICLYSLLLVKYAIQHAD